MHSPDMLSGLASADRGLVKAAAMPPTALVLAPQAGQDRVVTGLTLSARGKRVAAKAGIDPDRVHVIRTVQELSRARAEFANAPILLIRVTRQVVAPPLVQPLRPGEAGTRIAVDPDGSYAGAAQVDAKDSIALLNALEADFEAGEEALAASWEKVTVNDRAHHPAGTREEARAADAWLFQLIHKPLDGFLPAFLSRPLARPFTRIFLHLPFTPNHITMMSLVLSLTGCFIAASPSWDMHVLGLTLLMFGYIFDTSDGEIARLRMQESKFGASLDTMGDDVVRLALITAIGLHIAPHYPSWPISWLIPIVLALTLTSVILVYWYCIFVVGTWRMHDYEELFGVGKAVAVTGRRSLRRILGDAGTTMARRVFIDPAALTLALLGLSWISFAALGLGSVIGLAMVLPVHLRLVNERRSARTGELRHQ